MTKLYYTEAGHLHAEPRRGAHHLPPRAQGPHPSADRVSLRAVTFWRGRTRAQNSPSTSPSTALPLPPVPPQEAWHTWYEVPIDFRLLQAGDNVLEFWSDSTAMNSWALGLEAGHADPNRLRQRRLRPKLAQPPHGLPQCRPRRVRRPHPPRRGRRPRSPSHGLQRPRRSAIGVSQNHHARAGPRPKPAQARTPCAP